VIDHDHLRFVEPRLKSYLVTCLDKVSHQRSSRRRQGEALLHLSAAFFAGFGVQQDHKHALELLVQSAEYECLRAQALVKRMHDAMGIECPPNLPIQLWLVAGAETGSLIASKDLRHYYPELYPSAMDTFRATYHGIGKRGLDCATVANQEEDSHSFDLHTKAAHGDLESVLSLLTGNASSNSINLRNLSGETPLLCACRSGHLAIVQNLLDHGADASINSYSGESPMHWLSSFSDGEIPTIGQRLLDCGAMLHQHADSNVTYFPHFFNGLSAGTPLLRSVARGSKAAVEWLLQQGAQPSRNQYEESIGKTSSRRKDVYLSGDWLGAKGLRGNSSISLKQKKISPVANACASHYCELTEILLQAETVDLLNCHATPASHYGLWDRFRDEIYTKAMAWTMDYTVEPANTDAFDRLNVVTPDLTLLYFACGGESVFARMAVNGLRVGEAMKETIDLLVANGASLSQVNKYGASALHAAVEGGNVDIAEYLLTNYQICRDNVDTPYQGCKRLRLIHLAILQDDMPMFRLLLDFGASISWGIQACAAANHQNFDFFRELVDRGAAPGPYPPFSPPLPFALVRRNFLLAGAIIQRWPETLQLEVDGFNILQFVVVHTVITGRADVRALEFLLSYLRKRDIALCGPHHYFKADIMGVLVVSSWGGHKIEPLDDDWEQAETIKRTCKVLLDEYGQHKNVDLGKAVHAAVETRNLVALEALLKHGADPNYISEIFNQKLGFAPMDKAMRYLGLGYLKINVPADVEQAGDSATAKHKQRSQTIADLLRKYGAKTAYEQKGAALYGERVGAVIGYTLTFGILSDFFSERTVGDAEWWIRKRKRWISKNVPYM
jgi:Ankyrin repeats (3 copies)/Ankyrin repeats (many copies)